MGIIVFCGIFYPFINSVKTQTKISVGIELKDSHFVSKLAIEIMLKQTGLIEGLEITDISNGEYNRNQFSCIISIPENFAEGVMNGQNPAPKIIINDNVSKFEEIYLRELANAAETYLGAAQAGVYGVINYANSKNLTGKQLDDIVLQINSIYINQFLNKDKIIKDEILSPYENLSPINYIVGSVVVFLALVIGFLSAFIISNCSKLAVSIKNKDISCILGGLTVVSIPIIMPLLGGIFLFNLLSVKTVVNVILFSIITACFAGIIGLLTPYKESQLAIGGVISLAFIFLGGCVIPTSIMPKIFGIIEKFMPTYYMRVLILNQNINMAFVHFYTFILCGIFLMLWRFRKNEKPF